MVLSSSVWNRDSRVQSDVIFENIVCAKCFVVINCGWILTYTCQLVVVNISVVFADEYEDHQSERCGARCLRDVDLAGAGGVRN